MSSTIRASAAATFVASGAFACAAGLFVARSAGVLPWARLADCIVLACASVLVAFGLARACRVRMATALAATWLLALAFFAGVMPVLSVALLALAAIAIGDLLMPRGRHLPTALALSVGLVVIGGVAGWTLRWPIHHAWLYAPLLLAICLVQRVALAAAWQSLRQGWTRAVDADPRAAAFALLVLGLVSIGAWLPTMQSDDLAYHLALPSQLQRWGVYAPDPAQQIWALAPWLGDVLQGIAQVVAGREARGALDALWLCATAAGLWSLAHRVRSDARGAWLVVALFASEPMLLWLLGGMQTELPTCALMVALALLILDDSRGRLFAGAVLVAGLVGLKFGSAVSALVLLGWAILRERGRLPWARLPGAFVLFLLLAGSSYLLAWRLGGNPLLPLFNNVFRSPVLAPEQLSDPRWHAGFGLALPWQLTFDTDRYGEVVDGGFGFVFVAAGAAWAVALFRRDTRGLAIVATLATLLPLLPMQYARYAFPGLVLMLPPLVVAILSTLGTRAGSMLLCTLCALNIAFQANANWLVRTGGVRRLVRDGGNPSALYERYAPERAIAAALRERDDGTSIVLALDVRSPYLAELAGRGRTLAHYAPRLNAAAIAADADPGGARWQALIVDVGARWIVLRPERLGAAQRRALAALRAERVAIAGDAELWSVAVAPTGATP